jgi:hypothetical protein
MSIEAKVILIVGIGGALVYYFVIRSAANASSAAVTNTTADLGTAATEGLQTGLLTAIQTAAGLPYE